MSERTCKRCGSIDFGIWGYIGLIGYSLIMGSMGYALCWFLIVTGIWYVNLIIVGILFGLVFLAPMSIISFVEQRENQKNG